MDTVRRQYEAYPYPERDPADEDNRLIIGSPSHLDEIRHYLFAGRRPPELFRVLVAGGGTGDGLIMLADQCRAAGIEAEITYLDLSTEARRIAQARAERRGLSSIRFHTGSLLDLESVGGGPFDYIDCCGVLHHLADPPAGLAALRDALSPGGGMGLMVYAPLGRTGVYPLQNALRSLTAGLEPSEKVALGKTIVQSLPPTNWFVRNPGLGDHRNSDAGFYDLLLHSQDRAYTVREFAEYLASAGLAPAAWLEPVRYDPMTYLKPEMAERLGNLDQVDKWALAENLAGNIKMHTVYAVPVERADSAVAQPRMADAIPISLGFDAPALGRALSARKANRVLPIEFDGLTLRFVMPALAGPILSAIDGKSSIRQIHKKIAGQSRGTLDWPAFMAQFQDLYRSLNGANKLLLRLD